MTYKQIGWVLLTEAITTACTEWTVGVRMSVVNILRKESVRVKPLRLRPYVRVMVKTHSEHHN